jgi:hypothetical protein
MTEGTEIQPPQCNKHREEEVLSVLSERRRPVARRWGNTYTGVSEGGNSFIFELALFLGRPFFQRIIHRLLIALKSMKLNDSSESEIQLI